MNTTFFIRNQARLNGIVICWLIVTFLIRLFFFWRLYSAVIDPNSGKFIQFHVLNLEFDVIIICEWVVWEGIVFYDIVHRTNRMHTHTRTVSLFLTCII